MVKATLSLVLTVSIGLMLGHLITKTFGILNCAELKACSASGE